jgi:hypothetical protein
MPKYSRFRETRAGDWVRSELRGGCGSPIRLPNGGFWEPKQIKARTAEGRDAPKAAVSVWAEHKLTPHQQDEVRKRKAEGQTSS